MQKELLSLRNQLRDAQDRLESGSGGAGAGHDETETETETTSGSELDDLLAAQKRINQLTTRCDQLTRERNQLIKQVGSHTDSWPGGIERRFLAGMRLAVDETSGEINPAAEKGM